MVPCLETGLALVWSVRMTSEDPIPLDQDPMQSWIGVAHSGGLCTLGKTCQGDHSNKATTCPRRPLKLGSRNAISSQMTLDKETTW